jgi:hypothetical protein
MCTRKIRGSMMKIEKVSNTYVRRIDTDKREVWLKGSARAYSYADDSIVLLLQKAMTRKAVFIIKNQTISWIELGKEAHEGASEWGKKRRDLLPNMVEETLEQVFEEDGAKIICDYVKNKCHLKREEIAEKPEVFSSGLRRLLGSGASVIEILILKNLYCMIGLTFVEKKGYEFSDYIKELRKRCGC